MTSGCTPGLSHFVSIDTSRIKIDPLSLRAEKSFSPLITRRFRPFGKSSYNNGGQASSLVSSRYLHSVNYLTNVAAAMLNDHAGKYAVICSCALCPLVSLFLSRFICNGTAYRLLSEFSSARREV